MISIIAPVCIFEEELFLMTKELLENIRKEINEKDEIIVIDNGSTIGRHFFLRISDIYIRTSEILGGAEATNLGLRIANGDYFLIASNDVKVSSDWLTKMLEKFKEDSKIGIVSCHGQHMISTTGTAFNGIFYMIKKEAFQHVGLFDSLRLKEGYDSDYCLRAVKEGWDIATAEFQYEHPKRRSTFSQAEYSKRTKNHPLSTAPTFLEKWGFIEQDWYKKALEMRK